MLFYQFCFTLRGPCCLSFYARSSYYRLAAAGYDVTDGYDSGFR